MEFKEVLPFLVPVVLIELGLLVVALRDLLRPERRTKGPKWAWGLVLLVGIFGPIAYLLFGREE